MLSGNIYFGSTDSYYALYYEANIPYASNHFAAASNWDPNSQIFNITNSIHPFFGLLSPTGYVNSYPISSLKYYTNVDVLDKEGNVVLEKNDYSLSDFTDPVFTKKDLDNIIKNNNIDTSIYDNYFIFFKEWYSSGNTYYTMHLYLFKNDDLDNIYIKDNSQFWSNPSTSLYYEYVNSPNKKIDISLYNENMNFYNNWNYNNFDSLTKNYIYYSNVDIKDNNGNVAFPKRELPDSVSEDEEFTINFHLNGGTVTIPNVEICDDIGCYIKDEIHYEDYSIKLSSKDFEDYLLNQIVKDNIRHFNGWYYDEKLLNKVKVTDDITNNIDLYAKWSYESVDDLLNNVDFKKYTFNTKYEYAIISSGDNVGDIYIGLENRIFNLEIYEYIESSKEYIKGSTLNLVPIFTHDGINYYKLDPKRTDNINIIVLPKSKLENIQNGVITTYYDFYLSDNVNITYTNNLGKAIIYDNNGNKIETDLQESYDYSQDVLLKNETEDSINAFIKPIKFIFSSITEFYNDYCPPVVQKFFYISFIVLITLFIIRLIW